MLEKCMHNTNKNMKNGADNGANIYEKHEKTMPTKTTIYKSASLRPWADRAPPSPKPPPRGSALERSTRSSALRSASRHPPTLHPSV